MPSEGTRSVDTIGQGDGTYAARSLPKSKRKYVQVDVEDGLWRDFGSKNPRVIARRRDVAVFWRQGSTSREIHTLINEQIKRANARSAEKGGKQTPLVTWTTVKKDLWFVKRWMRAEAKHALEHGFDEVFVALQENVAEALRIRASAKTHRERMQSVQLVDNVVRTYLKVIGYQEDITVGVNKLVESKAEVKVTGAPPEVRYATLEAEAEVIDDDDD